MRALTILALVVSTVGFLLSMSNPVAFANVKDALIRVTDRTLNAKPVRAVEVARSDSGEFSLRAKINGVSTPIAYDPALFDFALYVCMVTGLVFVSKEFLS